MKLNKRNIDRIIYEDDVKELNVSIETKDRLYRNFFAVRSKPQFEEGSWIERVTVGGIDVECKWLYHGGILVMDSIRDEIQAATDKHLHKLFRTPAVDLKPSGNNVAQNMFPNVQNVTDLGVRLGKDYYSIEVGIDSLDPVLERFPNLESINVDWRHHGDIRFESRLFQIDDIHMNWSAHNASILSENFIGRCITLRNANLDETDAIRFLDAWISEEKYQQLKSCYLIVCQDRLYECYSNGRRQSRGFDYQKVLNMYRGRAKSWDRPNDGFRYSRAILFDTSIDDSMLFHEGHTLDIERNTDGKKATFTISRHDFWFCVWD